MAKIGTQKLPRKLKKEFKKVEDFTAQQNEYMDFPFIHLGKIRLKKGVKRNRSTDKLLNELTRQLLRSSLSPFEGLIKSKMSIEEFREAYENKPNLGYLDHRSKDDTMFLRSRSLSFTDIFVIDDEENPNPYVPRTKQEEKEWEERSLIFRQAMTKVDSDGDVMPVLTIKNLTLNQAEELRKEFKNQRGTPVLPKKASLSFNPYRLHNHPRLEMEYALDTEVIVDVEFVNFFTDFRFLEDLNGNWDFKHIIVSKDEFMYLLNKQD